jgi:hypothetical protein
MDKLKSQASLAGGKQYSMSSRIKEAKWLVVGEAVFYLLVCTAIVVATGCFLWHPNESSSKYQGYMVCNDVFNYQEVPDGYAPLYTPNCDKVDVYARFTSVLRLYFAFYIIQWVRTALIIVAALYQSETLGKLYDSAGCI